MLALARVGVFEQGGPVEGGQAVAVAREVGRHPVEQDADTSLVQHVDEDAEIVGRAEAAGGRVVAHGLVTPGCVERMLAHGQQLDVGVAHRLAVLGELSTQVLVGEEAVVGRALPRAEVHFVDADWRVQALRLGASRHPLVVVPGVARQIPDDRRGARAELRGEAKWVGFLQPLRREARLDAVLVDRALAQAGDEALPDARGLARAQRGGPRIPLVEVADHTHGVRVWRPDGETDARCTVDRCDMGSEFLVDASVGTLIEKVQVDIS